MILTATINEVKRRVTFDNPQAVVAVKGDYEVNGIAFAFPAIYEDDFDLSTAVKTVYYKATDGIIYNHVVTDTDTDTGYPLWVFKDEINKGAYGDVEFALVCDKVEGGNIVKRWVSMITVFRVQKSIEIDESEQEDNEQTYSERLAYLMTQMANMQATVSGLASGAPTPVSLASAMTDTSRLYVYTGSESGYTAGHWYYYNGSAWADGGLYGGTSVDTTLTVSGAAADAKVVGDELDEIKEDLSDLQAEIESGGSGLTADLKAALDQLAQKIAYIDAGGQAYYDALHAALYPPVNLTRISCVYTQSGAVYKGDTLDSLKSNLVVTAHYDNGTTQTVTTYTLSGTLAEGTNIITVSYEGKTATFTVTVLGYTWRYDASDGILLSAMSDIVNASIGKECTESLVDGYLNLNIPVATNETIRYYFTDTTSANAKLTAKVRFNALPYVAGGSGFRLQLSDGTSGAQIFEAQRSSGGMFVTYEKEQFTDKLALTLGQWYVISVERAGDRQIVSVDDTEILNSSVMSTNYCTSNAVIVQSAPTTVVTGANVDVEWIEFVNYD